MNKKKLRIANSEITIGNKYILDHKPNPNALNGLTQFTKLPFENNITVDMVYFDEARGQYDTGFHPNSLCLNILPEGEKQALLTQYNKNIKEPYEKAFNANLDQNSSNTFWEKYKIEAYVNKVFDTSDVKQLMELFHVLYSGLAVEKGEKNPKLNKNAQFIITSTERVKNKNKERVKILTEAFLAFNTLLKANRDDLNLILQWIGKDDPSKISNEDLGTIYYQIINGEKGENFSEKFLKILEDYNNSEQIKYKLELFYAIKKLYLKRDIKKTNRGYVSAKSELPLANSLQEIAEFCMNEESQQFKEISRLIEENPEVRRDTSGISVEYLRRKK